MTGGEKVLDKTHPDDVSEDVMLRNKITKTSFKEYYIKEPVFKYNFTESYFKNLVMAAPKIDYIKTLEFESLRDL